MFNCFGSSILHFVSPHLKRVICPRQLFLRGVPTLRVAVFSGNTFTRSATQAPNIVRRKSRFTTHNNQPHNVRFLPTKGVSKSSQFLEVEENNKRFYSTIIWLLIKPLAKVVAIIIGRLMRTRFRALNQDERQRILSFFRDNAYAHSALVGACLVLLGIYYLSHLETATITGRKVYLSYSKENVAELAQFQTDILVEIFKESFITGQDHRVKRAIDVAKRIVNANPATGLIAQTWTIYIINEPLVNAFVLPNGHIFVFNGSLIISDTDDQLAIILGHEMAHAVLRHGVEGLSRSSLLDWFLIFGFAFIWFIIPYDMLACLATVVLDKGMDLLVNLPASRQQEWEADHVGLIFAANACYDVREAGVLWRKIAKEQEQVKSVVNMPVWTGTHPDSYKRAEYLDSLLVDAEGWRKANGCPPLSHKVNLPRSNLTK